MITEPKDLVYRENRSQENLIWRITVSTAADRSRRMRTDESDKAGGMEGFKVSRYQDSIYCHIV